MADHANGVAEPDGNAPAPTTTDQTTDAQSDPLQNGHKLVQSSTKTGTGLKDKFKAKLGPPGGFDTTPLPDAPQGYTIRFIFHSATNLAPGDLVTNSSDPFILATLKGTQPKRHKEDPDLVHRTPTITRITEPVWDDAWVVANVPPTGFTLKCRIYDEDYPDADDRLGNVTIKIPSISDDWAGIPAPGKEYEAKRRMISKRAYALKALSTALSKDFSMTPRVRISMEVLGKSDPPFAQMYTVGPTTWVKHFSPLIGRIAGVKVNANEEDDARPSSNESKKSKSKTQKYDFQANQMHLQGPVPPRMYHRYVEFKPIIASIYSGAGLRGKIINKALHKQHARIYNYNQSTEYGSFEACSQESSQQFLRMAHFDEGGRVFTYVLTLDGLFRFTETGKEFGIDMLSKHTMHSDVETYIACSGEFFIRRLNHPVASDDPNPSERTHPDEPLPNGPPVDKPPLNPAFYQIVIDNDSGTYRPDKSILPDLQEFLQRNFPDLGVVTMHWEDEQLQKMKEAQRAVKKKEGRMMNMVMNRSSSSIGSAESDLDDREGGWEHGQKSKREMALEALENPTKAKVKDAIEAMLPGGHHPHEKSENTGGESSRVHE